MNAQRRKQIEKLCERFNMIDNGVAEFRGHAEDLANEIEELRDEEQEYLDNMPENLQQSEKYATAESSIQEMERLMEGLNDLVQTIDNMPNSNDLLEVI